jgi:hypothetical protein
MTEQYEDLASQLSNLREQFSNASGEWPNFQSVFITWPEDKLRPVNLPQRLGGAYAIPVPAPEGESHYRNTFLSGTNADTPADRYRKGVAGMLVPRRSSFGNCGDQRENTKPNKLQECNQRFTYLVNQGSPFLKEYGTKIGLSENMLKWANNQRVAWLLALHETIKPTAKKLTEFYTHESLDRKARKLIEFHNVEVIGDVFHASADVIDTWLRILRDGQGKSPIPPNQETVDTIISLGNCLYRIDNSEQILVTDNEDNVLQAFLESPAMDSATLHDKSGVPYARRVLKKVSEKNNNLFSPAINFPGTKSGGGYRVSIQEDTSP